MDQFVDAAGVPTSKLALAQDHWLQMSLHQRTTLMQRVSTDVSLEKSHRALMEHIAATVPEFQVSDDGVLTSSVNTAKVEPGMKKQFLGMWSETVFENDGTRTIDDDFFSESNGYNDEDRRRISALAVGETWEIDPYGESHTVTRLPDVRAADKATDEESEPPARQRLRL